MLGSIGRRCTSKVEEDSLVELGKNEKYSQLAVVRLLCRLSVDGVRERK
jgi:hypothetical protein